MDQALADKDGIKPSQAWRYREEVRAKYGLPESGLRYDDPRDYMRRMKELLKEMGVNARPTHEFQPFFKKHPASAVTFNDSVFGDAVIVTGKHQLITPQLILQMKDKPETFHSTINEKIDSKIRVSVVAFQRMSSPSKK